MIENVNVRKTVAAPADQVWSAISGIGGLERWFPVIASCRVEGVGVGAIRTMELAGGGAIKDRIDVIDPASRRVVYTRFVHPFPVSKYVGTVDVRPAGTERAEILWSLEIDVAPENLKDTSAFLEKALSDGIAGLGQDLR